MDSRAGGSARERGREPAPFPSHTSQRGTSRPGVATQLPATAPRLPRAVLGSAPSLPVPPSRDLVPPSFPAPDTSSPRLPPGAAKFLRSGPRAEPGPGRSGAPRCPVPARRPRARPRPHRAMLCGRWRSCRRRPEEPPVAAQVAAPLLLSPPDGDTKRPGLRALKKMGQ